MLQLYTLGALFGFQPCHLCRPPLLQVMQLFFLLIGDIRPLFCLLFLLLPHPQVYLKLLLRCKFLAHTLSFSKHLRIDDAFQSMDQIKDRGRFSEAVGVIWSSSCSLKLCLHLS
jgi:hypothetical protein